MLYIIDTETTGLSPHARAVEVAWLRIDDELNVLEEVHSLIDPEIEIEPEASKIHGIYTKDIEHEPTMEEFLALNGGPFLSPCTVIGHNVKFDVRFHRQIFNITQQYCTLELARATLPQAPNHKLGTLREYLSVDGGNAHRALGDCYTVLRILQCLLPKTGRTLRQHLSTPRRMLNTAPFGKYKGQLIANIPGGYRSWLLKQDIDPDFRYTLEILKGIE